MSKEVGSKYNKLAKEYRDGEQQQQQDRVPKLCAGLGPLTVKPKLTFRNLQTHVAPNPLQLSQADAKRLARRLVDRTAKIDLNSLD